VEGQLNDLYRTNIACAFLLMIVASLPAFAQIDFSGHWAARAFEDSQDRGGGPDIGDYLGVPLSEAGRMRADAWQASMFTLPEWQCRPHGSDYIWRGPQELKITKEVDPVTRQTTAFHTEWLRSMDVPVYLDGRPHPPEYALHTWWGFKTATWQGDTLAVKVTHAKENYMKRNGVARSDTATMNEYWIRHGDIMTVVTIVRDPVILTEPWVRSVSLVNSLKQVIPPYPCDRVEEIDRPAGVIPHYLPGTNPDLRQFGTKRGVPYEATRGGAETMYPEYMSKVKQLMSNPSAQRD
jgi:hypothetical protein